VLILDLIDNFDGCIAALISDLIDNEEDGEAVKRSPFELESNVENLVEEERSRLMRAHLYRTPTSTRTAEGSKQANIHDEF